MDSDDILPALLILSIVILGLVLILYGGLLPGDDVDDTPTTETARTTPTPSTATLTGTPSETTTTETNTTTTDTQNATCPEA